MHEKGGEIHQFDRLLADSSLFDVPDASEIDLQGEDYDFNSATHFSASDYSTGSNPIFTLVDTSDTLEQHDGLSEIDVRRINKAYNCDFITSGTLAGAPMRNIID